MHLLEHLDLHFSSIQDDVVEAIACIGANLRLFNLNNMNTSSVEEEILAGHVPNFEVLSLSNTSIDDVLMTSNQHCLSLQNDVDLMSCSVCHSDC